MGGWVAAEAAQNFGFGDDFVWCLAWGRPLLGGAEARGGGASDPPAREMGPEAAI